MYRKHPNPRKPPQRDVNYEDHLRRLQADLATTRFVLKLAWVWTSLALANAVIQLVLIVLRNM